MLCPWIASDFNAVRDIMTNHINSGMKTFESLLITQLLVRVLVALCINEIKL